MKNKKSNYSKPELFISIVELEDVVLLSSGKLGIENDDTNAFKDPTEIL